jgi:talin
MGDCKTMADHIPSLVEGVKGTLSDPENPAAQLNLINASEQFLQVCEWPRCWNVVRTACAVYPVLPACADNLTSICELIV